MNPTKPGQIVKFHTPLKDENPDQMYVVLDYYNDPERSRVKVQALNTNLAFPPVNVFIAADFEVIQVNTADLIGELVTINREDCTHVYGRVISVEQEKIDLDLLKNSDGVKTNVWLTVRDKEGIEHTGTLFVN